jgi:hypothetical protein
MGECEPGTARIRADGTREVCIGGIWVPVAEPIREPPVPNIAVIVNTPDQLHAVAKNAELAKLLEDADTHLVISVEHTRHDEAGGAAAAGDVAGAH